MLAKAASPAAHSLRGKHKGQQRMGSRGAWQQGRGGNLTCWADEIAAGSLRAVVEVPGVRIVVALGNDLIHGALATVIAAHARVAGIIAVVVLIEECEARAVSSA